ncbi:DUF72 domain-containing protein [Edaphobacter modestus]|uniref:Uncharacterized protein YecE (DUF72 family) n=1 Tax=Edaphobacter modestus TaxID=388466 RepID=A0A4Q7YU69_9BACT|nr:DUF72 domain-containing protein [Edaphobacter modestus]RZU41130.1 uncharacterized protein YecE (DUF72 family) [Edaphobacter modestus]
MARLPQAPPPSSEIAATAAAARVFAGTSGWAYPTWKPDFYPDRTPAKRFLEFYSRKLSSVEVNYTFRAFPTAAMLEGWLASTPDFFRFSFKAPQRITHIKRLANCESDVAYFVSVLEPARQAGKLGLLLFQLPPNLKADAARLESFLSAPALRGPGALSIAFEFRHESWFNDEIYAILRSHNAALCIAESDDLATPEVHTAPAFTSFRLRRTGAYTPAELDAFVERFATLAANRDVYVYFKHEDEPSGALNAVAFLEGIAARKAKQ